MKNNRLWSFFALLCCLFVLNQARADVVVYQFSGELLYPFGVYPVGTPFKGSFSYKYPQPQNVFSLGGGLPAAKYNYRWVTLEIGNDLAWDQGSGWMLVKNDTPLVGYTENGVPTPHYHDEFFVYPVTTMQGSISGKEIIFQEGFSIFGFCGPTSWMQDFALPGASMSLADLESGPGVEHATFLSFRSVEYPNPDLANTSTFDFSIGVITTLNSFVCEGENPSCPGEVPESLPSNPNQQYPTCGTEYPPVDPIALEEPAFPAEEDPTSSVGSSGGCALSPVQASTEVICLALFVPICVFLIKRKNSRLFTSS